MRKKEDNKIKFSIDIINPKSKKAKLLPPHIRKNKITGHYAIIIAEDGDAYLFLPMVTKELSRNKNYPLNPNPNRSSTRSSYVILRLRRNKKGAFTAPLDWKLSPKDLEMIIAYAKSKIK